MSSQDGELRIAPGRAHAPLMRICECGAHVEPEPQDREGRTWCETCGNCYDAATGAPVAGPEDEEERL